MVDLRASTDHDGLSGKAFVVTGSSRGIGRAIAAELLAAGATVGICSRRIEESESVAAELGEQALPLAADLTSPHGPAQLIGDFVARAGRLDGLVNNAGVSILADALSLDRDTWRQVMELNVTATFFCAQAAAEAMHGEGVILNISSISGYTGLPRRAVYAASKAAVMTLTKVLAVEWAPGIRVVGLSPGYVLTESFRAVLDEGEFDRERIFARTPLGRFAEPEEIARAAAFLCGDRASFVTGDVLAVDGGWLSFGAA